MIDTVTSGGYRLIWLGFAILALIAYYIRFKRKHPLTLVDVRYTFPIFGKMSKAVRRRNLHANSDGLTNAEETLFKDYHAHIPRTSETAFRRAYDFLLYGRQADRRDAHPFMLGLIGFFLVAEALGFAVLLVPVVSESMTPFLSNIVAPAIAILLAGIGGFLMHWGGHDLYEKAVLRRMLRLADDKKVPIFSKLIRVDDDQEIDAGMAECTRYGNRNLQSTSARPIPYWFWGAVAYIALITVVSTGVRFGWLTAGHLNALAGSGSASGGNPFASANLPAAVQSNASAAHSALESGKAAAKYVAGAFGIVGLTVIFIFTQIIAMIMGFAYTTSSNKRMVAARLITKGYSTYDEFFRHEIENKAGLVDRRITALRERLFHDTTEAETSHMTYEEWVTLDSERKMVARDASNDLDRKRRVAHDSREMRTAPPSEASGSAHDDVVQREERQPSQPAEWTAWVEHIFEAPSGQERVERIMDKMRGIPSEAQRLQFRNLLQQEKEMREAAAQLASDSTPPLEPESWMKDI